MAPFILKRTLFYLCLLFVREGFAWGLSLTAAAQNSTQLFGISFVDCQAGYDWASNSLDQDPCTVAAWLIGACDDFIGWGNVYSLSNCKPYNSPMDGTDLPPSRCVCSSVFYNLLASCAGCQGEPYVTFTNYTTHCPTSYITDGNVPISIPSDTRIPAWAYLKPSQNNDWYNAPLSKKIGRNPENQRLSNPTGVSHYSPPKPSCSGGPHDDSNGGNGSGGSTKTGSIVGGIVGGVAAVAAVVAVAYVVHAKMAAASAVSAAAAAKGAAASGGAGATAGYGTGGGVSAAAGAAQAPFAAGGVAGAAPGVSATVGSGTGIAGSGAASGISSGVGATFAPGVSASVGPGATFGPGAAASMAPGVGASVSQGASGAFGVGASAGSAPGVGGFAPAGGAGAAGMAPGFAGAGSALASGSGAGVGSGPVIGGVAGGVGGAGIWRSLFGTSKNRRNDPEGAYAPEMTSTNNDTSLLMSPHQPPSFISGSTPQSPTSFDPGFLPPGARPPVSPVTPLSAGSEVPSSQSPPYYLSYFQGAQELVEKPKP